MRSSDERLVRGHSDPRAALCDRHGLAAYVLVFRSMGPATEIDVVVHDIFVQALEWHLRLRDPAGLRSSPLGIAVPAVGIGFQSRGRRRWLRFMAAEVVPKGWTPPATDLGEARDVCTSSSAAWTRASESRWS
jgi:hypothetical protein